MCCPSVWPQTQRRAQFVEYWYFPSRALLPFVVAVVFMLTIVRIAVRRSTSEYACTHRERENL